MTGRHSLLAELEARRHQKTGASVEVLSAELTPNPDRMTTRDRPRL